MNLRGLQQRHMNNNVFGAVNRFNGAGKGTIKLRPIDGGAWEEFKALVGPEKRELRTDEHRREMVYVRRLTIQLDADSPTIADKFEASIDGRDGYYVEGEYSRVANAIRTQVVRHAPKGFIHPEYYQDATGIGFESGVG